MSKMFKNGSASSQAEPLKWDVFVTPLNPRAVVRDFDRLAATTSTGRELYEKMLKLYPNRVPRSSSTAFTTR